MASLSLETLVSDVRAAGEFRLSHGSVSGLTANEVAACNRAAFESADKGIGGKTRSAKLLQSYARLSLAAEELRLVVADMHGEETHSNSTLAPLVIMEHAAPIAAYAPPIIMPPEVHDKGVWLPRFAFPWRRMSWIFRWFWPYMCMGFVLCRPRLLQLLLRTLGVKMGNLVGSTLFTGVSAVADGLEHSVFDIEPVVCPPGCLVTQTVPMQHMTMPIEPSSAWYPNLTQSFTASVFCVLWWVLGSQNGSAS